MITIAIDVVGTALEYPERVNELSAVIPAT